MDLLANRKKVSVNLLTDRSIRELTLDGKIVLCIEVPRASRKQKPVYLNGNPLDGNCYRRFDEADQRMSDEEVKMLLAEQTQESLDYRVLPRFTMDDIALQTLQVYRQTHATLNPGHHWTGLTNIEFLKEIRAWNSNRESGEEGLTVAGLLMFGKFQSIQDEFPNYAPDYQERPEAKTEQRWIDRVSLDGSWSGNLYDFYRLVYPKLVAGIKVPFAIKNGLRDEDTPVHIALREALANAIIHADYRQRSRLLIVKRPDMFGFQNPGDMRIPLELAIKGDEPDCRNRRLAHMFSFVNIGEKAGTGIPKILSNWNTQHWRKPSLTEEYSPNPRTILRLQMLDLFPPGILDILGTHFGEDFEKLDESERMALAITLSERRLSHGRLGELTDLHPTDISKVLRGLVERGFLETEGNGRGTVYRFVGTQVVNPEDVFGGTSSVDLESRSVDLETSSVDLESSSVDPERDALGKLVSSHHHLAFIDSLDSLSTEELKRLEEIATEPRVKKSLNQEKMEKILREICTGHFVTLEVISTIVQRKSHSIRAQYLTPMCREQKLRRAFPDKPNHPLQAYTST